MTGFMASLVWYWGRPRLDPAGGGAQVPLVRHHLILSGAPVEILDLLAKFVDSDIVTYKTPDFFAPVNLVFVLKNDCAEQFCRRMQCNGIVGSSDLRD